MCGICGFVGQPDAGALDRMLTRLVHRGPDEEGRHQAPGVSFGVRRLRVIDPEGGRQPVTNETGTVWAVLNGEIYNYRELREELIHKGHRFASQCDTEVLAHLYEEEGAGAVHRLRGMFAFALWDQTQQMLLLVRDRLGIKPLYYAIRSAAGGHSRVIFSSELPSLLSALPEARIRPQAILDYLTLLYVPGPATMYEEIYQLRPGEMIRITNDHIEFRRYYRPEEDVLRCAGGSEEETSDRLVALLRDSVRAHLVSDVPLGLFLSGGLDSSAILALMRQVISGRIRTFTIGYGASADESYNELAAARSLAIRFETDHTEERLQPDVAGVLPHVVAAMGEPFADSSAIPTFLVSEVARRSVTVALSGIGGDELFGGYPRYLGMRAASHYARLPEVARRIIASSVAPRLGEGIGGRDQVGRLKRFLLNGHRPLQEQYLRWITFLPAEWGLSAFAPGVLETCRGDELARTYESLFGDWPSADPTDRAMGLDLRTYLPDDLLRMGDRMSMAHSLELRVPFCDHILLAFALRLSESARFSGWRTKGFLRKTMNALLPKEVLDGPKYGFRIPLARWIREDLREMVHDLLSERAIRRRGYLNPAYVQWVLREHERGARNFADQIYALVVLELWHRSVETN